MARKARTLTLEQQKLLRTIFTEFEKAGEWVSWWQIDRRLVNEFDVMEVGTSLPDGLVVWKPQAESLSQQQARLTFEALRLLPEAEQFLDDLVAISRVAAEEYFSGADDPALKW